MMTFEEAVELTEAFQVHCPLSICRSQMKFPARLTLAMKNYVGVPSRFALLVAGLLTVGCMGPQRTYPAADGPTGGAPAPREIISTNTSWEREFGQVQGVKANGLVMLSGQMSLDEKGLVVGKGSMDVQMRQAYANVAKVLQQFNLTMNDVLEETLYVTDIPPALTVGPKIRREVYGGPPTVASTLLQVQRLAFADALIEIRIIAKAGITASPRSGGSSSDDSPRRGGRGGGRGRGGGYGGSSPY